VVALACSHPPEGKKRWSMQMLADKLLRARSSWRWDLR
jgi:hypothetical protein